MKSHIRDYATEAFRFYAKNGKSVDRYKQEIYNEALEEMSREKGSGISCPTEAAIMRAEAAVSQKIADVRDMEAVEMTLAEIRARAYERSDIVRAIEMVYFKDADKPLEKGDIHSRVHFAEINIPASERSIYYYLSKARAIFAEHRGLRI